MAALVTNDGKIYVVRTHSYIPEVVCEHLCQANAGDSRSVISTKGEAKQLSYDHKPQNESALRCVSRNRRGH